MFAKTIQEREAIIKGTIIETPSDIIGRFDSETIETKLNENLEKGLISSLEWNESIDNLDLIKGGKKATVGERRGNRIKTTEGWKYVKNSAHHQGKADEHKMKFIQAKMSGDKDAEEKHRQKFHDHTERAALAEVHEKINGTYKEKEKSAVSVPGLEKKKEKDKESGEDSKKKILNEIGKTRSGKSIKESSEKENTKDFSGEDHADAFNMYKKHSMHHIDIDSKKSNHYFDQAEKHKNELGAKDHINDQKSINHANKDIIVGKTKSGKNIPDSLDKNKYIDFSSEDHRDAESFHNQKKNEIKNKTKEEKQNSDFYYHHNTHANFHGIEASKKQ